MKEAAKGLAASKKFLVFTVTVAALLIADYLKLNEVVSTKITALAGTLILGQGLADFGKAAK